MKKCINKVTIEGYLYQHTLALKTVQDPQSANYGKEYINGQIEIVVDEDGLNIIPVRYTYVTPTTSSGAVNRNYAVLKSIIDGGRTWIENGKDAAMKVKCDTSFALNDFYANDGSLVSQMVQEGGFISTVAELSHPEKRNSFILDLLITSVVRREADEEKGTLEHCEIRGAGFNFRNALLPMNFKLYNPQGMDYFEDLEASPANPVFLKVFGEIKHTTTQINRTEESAFGEAIVSSYDRKVKEWIITNASKNIYDFGDESVMTVEDVSKAMQDREVYLAGVKKRADDYKASKNSPTPAVAPAASTATFNF